MGWGGGLWGVGQDDIAYHYRTAPRIRCLKLLSRTTLLVQFTGV